MAVESPNPNSAVTSSASPPTLPVPANNQDRRTGTGDHRDDDDHNCLSLSELQDSIGDLMVPEEWNSGDYLDSGDYFKIMPPGFRFCPEDHELIVNYLKKKVHGKPLPRNKIVDVNIYRYNPEDLAEIYKDYGEKEWYFFTPRDRKYPNGKRPKRAAGDGYWKATGADRAISHDGKIVGYRKTLVFYRGKPRKSVKTNWIMHEYRADSVPPRKRNGLSDMTLDKYILSRIYKKNESAKAKLRGEGSANSDLENEDVNPNEDEDAMIESPDEVGPDVHDGRGDNGIMGSSVQVTSTIPRPIAQMGNTNIPRHFQNIYNSNRYYPNPNPNPNPEYYPNMFNTNTTGYNPNVASPGHQFNIPMMSPYVNNAPNFGGEFYGQNFQMLDTRWINPYLNPNVRPFKSRYEDDQWMSSMQVEGHDPPPPSPLLPPFPASDFGRSDFPNL